MKKHTIGVVNWTSGEEHKIGVVDWTLVGGTHERHGRLDVRWRNTS